MPIKTWRCPQIGLPPNHPSSTGIFHHKPSSYGEPPMTIWKPPAMDFPWPCVVSRGNQWQEALGCLENLDARAIQCDTILFNSVISACGKSGQWQTALELMQLTLQQAKVFRENDSHPLPLLLNVPNIENQGGRAVMRGRGLR